MIEKKTNGILFATLLGCLVAAPAATATAQDPKPASAKPDPWVKDSVKEFKKLASDRKGQKDAEAIELIDKMLQKYETMHPKDKVAFAKGIAYALTSTKVKRKPTNDGLYRTTVKALSLTGKNGSKHLASAFKNKSKYKGKEWLNLRGDMLEKLGRTKDEKFIGFLLDVALKDPHDTLMAKAGGALQHFDESKLAVRKDIVKKLIRKFTNIYDNANENLDPGDLKRVTWEQRLAAVSDPWNVTLQKLTKQHIRTPNDWNKFWNKNKNKNWDKSKSKGRRK